MKKALIAANPAPAISMSPNLKTAVQTIMFGLSHDGQFPGTFEPAIAFPLGNTLSF
jgi:hypothetical protein